MKYLPLIENILLILFVLTLKLAIIEQFEVNQDMFILLNYLWIFILIFLLTSLAVLILTAKKSIRIYTIFTSILGIALYLYYYEVFRNS
jgi:hypothetical protein